MFEQFWQKIEEYDNICIFRHVGPDGDAYGSQFGLAQYLKDTYPNKHIFCPGNDIDKKYDIFPSNDVVSDEIVLNSLCFILDTSTKKRIDDDRCLKAKDIIKIDHHQGSEYMTDMEYLCDNRASCSELVCEFIASKQDLTTISKQAAIYLYTGINTDTKDFSTTNTTYQSLEIASQLVKCGVSTSEIHYKVTKKSKAMFAFTSEFNSQMIITDNNLGYGFVSLDMGEKYGLNHSDTKDAVNEFDVIDGLLVWVCFSEKEKGIYSAGLRSRNVTINQIAAKYGGGGHKNACGADNLTKEQVEQMLKDLDEVITLEKKKRSI